MDSNLIGSFFLYEVNHISLASVFGSLPMTNTSYKCWVTRDTDNPRSVATLPDGEIAYSTCTTEVNDKKIKYLFEK